MAEDIMRRLLRVDDGVDHVADFAADWMPILGVDPDLFVAVRDDYLNVYYKGNSLAKIQFRARGFKYTVIVHTKFLDCMNLPEEVSREWMRTRRNQDPEFEGYRSLPLNPAHIPFMFTSEGLEEAKNVIDGLHSEEIRVEQDIIRATPPTSDLLVIDRQVADHEGGAAGDRMDFLALERFQGATYRPVYVELKLPNNSELWLPKPGYPDHPSVITQIDRYIKHMKRTAPDDSRTFGQVYARCYALQYEQKRRMGCLGDGLPATITIDHTRPRFVLLVADDGRVTRTGRLLAQHRLSGLEQALRKIGASSALWMEGDALSEALVREWREAIAPAAQTGSMLPDTRSLVAARGDAKGLDKHHQEKWLVYCPSIASDTLLYLITALDSYSLRSYGGRLGINTKGMHAEGAHTTAEFMRMYSPKKWKEASYLELPVTKTDRWALLVADQFAAFQRSEGVA